MTKEATCQSWKPEKTALASKSEEKEKRKKKFKVKTQKDSLNHKKWNKKKKKERSSWNPIRAAWLQIGFLDWKPEKAV